MTETITAAAFFILGVVVGVVLFRRRTTSGSYCSGRIGNYDGSMGKIRLAHERAGIARAINLTRVSTAALSLRSLHPSEPNCLSLHRRRADLSRRGP